MELFFGVPAHPFFVHAPIVLLPIAAIVTIVLAARPTWQHRGLAPLAVSGVVIVIALLLARQSGNTLAEVADGRAINGDITDHRTFANQTVVIAVLWLVALVAATVLDHRRKVATALSADVAAISFGPARIALIVAAVLGVLATIWIIRTGHTGAESHWVGVIRLIESG